MLVERVAGSGRMETAVAASRFAFPGGAPGVVLAAARTFPDALAAAPLAAGLGGPLLLVTDRLPPAVRDEIIRLGAREAVIVGGVGAVPAIVQAELRLIVADVSRIAGESRTDTAAEIARAVATRPLPLPLLPRRSAEAVVVSSLDFADAVSIGPFAAAHGLPVVLTSPTQLDPDAAAALRSLGVDRTLVIGGSAALSPAVEASLPGPTRVAGSDRYATSVAVAELALTREASLATVYVATGRDFPDALAAGPVAGISRSVVLLVDGQQPTGATAAHTWLSGRQAEIGRIVVFGGPGAVSDEVADQLARLGARA